MLNRLRLGALWTLGYASLALALLVIYVPPADAQTPAWNENVLTWTGHTTCTNDSPASNCPVTQWRLETAATATATTWDLVAFVPSSLFRYVHTGVAAGPHCYRVKGVAADGFVTAASPVLANSCKTNAVPSPTPPGSVTVATVTAYEVRRNSTGTMIASRIGVVPEGTVCTQETRTAPLDGKVVTFNRIDPGAVDLINWPARQPPVDVFARCSAG